MTARCFAGLLGLFVLAGCPHLHPWATDRDIEGTYDQVFQATLKTLEVREFPIDEVNRDDGRIVTGKRPVWVIEAHRRVESARADIREEEGETEVRLVLTLMDRSGTVQRGRPKDRSEAAEAVVAGSSAAVPSTTSTWTQLKSASRHCGTQRNDRRFDPDRKTAGGVVR